MKVKITLVLDVARDVWANEYGIENTASAVREDVKVYLAGAVDSFPLAETGAVKLVSYS